MDFDERTTFPLSNRYCTSFVMDVENQNYCTDSYPLLENAAAGDCPLLFAYCLNSETSKSQTDAHCKTVHYYFPHYFVSLKISFNYCQYSIFNDTCIIHPLFKFVKGFEGCFNFLDTTQRGIMLEFKVFV